MTSILERLYTEGIQDSSKRTYHKIWQSFNKFIIRLDNIPKKWEIRTGLFCAHLIWNQNKQSSTIKTYISAIKTTLKNDGYIWDDRVILLNSLTKACKLKNDVIKLRLPISVVLLDTILMEVSRHYHDQIYLQYMYMAMFSLYYYGMFRSGELAKSKHAIKAVNIHEGKNKNKYLIVLYTSKTHGLGKIPQQVNIVSKNMLEVENCDESATYFSRKNKLKNKAIYCPVDLLRKFINIRPPIMYDEEQLFIFRDRSEVKPTHVRNLLRKILNAMTLNGNNYDIHSFRIGRATDLDKENVSIDKIKSLGRWQSNAVYKYLRAAQTIK